MMKNNSMKDIADELLKAESVLLFPHVNMDGDTLGSCVALCKGLRQLSKKAYVLIDEDVPLYLNFLVKDYCVRDTSKIKNPDVCVAIDSGEVSRFLKRKEEFFSGKKTMAIDHHVSTDPIFDFNYIDPKASATAMIIFYLLKEMKVELDKEMGEALWAGITTDTGNFQYSNTNKETHLVVSQLYDLGIDHNKISINIYENVRREKVMMTNKVMDTLTFFSNGKGALCYGSLEVMKETGATPDETEGIVEAIRRIAGVEVAAFLREDGEKEIKVSLRSKTYADVSEIALRFNGGGHKNAAGCTINSTLDFAVKMIINEIEITLNNE